VVLKSVEGSAITGIKRGKVLVAPFIVKFWTETLYKEPSAIIGFCLESSNVTSGSSVLCVVTMLLLIIVAL
jgi:hypothetical protein